MWVSLGILRRSGEKIYKITSLPSSSAQSSREERQVKSNCKGLCETITEMLQLGDQLKKYKYGLFQNIKEEVFLVIM